MIHEVSSAVGALRRTRLRSLPAFDEVRALRRVEPGKAWSSAITLVSDPLSGAVYVLKERRLLPSELVEIDDVLETLAAAKPPYVCPVIAWTLAEHHLRLLLPWVEGAVVGRTSRDDRWQTRWDPAGLSISQRRRVAASLAEGLVGLHAIGLLYQDVKLNQVMLLANGCPMWLDIDTIILRDGVCARSAAWLPTQSSSHQCNVDTDVRMLGEAFRQLLPGGPLDRKIVESLCCAVTLDADDRLRQASAELRAASEGAP